jgi:transcription initiation factor TFIIIB Brf1 subunit/transcription initiation factor TFIIB
MDNDNFYYEETDVKISQIDEQMTETKEEHTDLCIHKNSKIENGVEICLNCGFELSKEINLESEVHFYHCNDTRTQNDPSRVYFRSVIERNIYKDLDKFALTQNIKEKINKAYLELVGEDIYRGNCRLGLIFAITFEIYKQLGTPKNKDDLNTVFKMPQKTITKGLKIYKMKMADKGIKNTSKSIKPMDYIPLIMERFNANKINVDKVKMLCEKINNKSSELNASKPLSVASGLVYYYCKSLGKEISVKDFVNIIKLNPSTILKMAKLIQNVLKTEFKL